MKTLTLLWLILGGLAVFLVNLLPSRYNAHGWLWSILYVVIGSMLLVTIL